jgi:hypothetical protein
MVRIPSWARNVVVLEGEPFCFKSVPLAVVAKPALVSIGLCADPDRRLVAFVTESSRFSVVAFAIGCVGHAVFSLVRNFKIYQYLI